MTVPVIVTLAQAQAHLRLSPMLTGSPGSPADDTDLQLKLDAATEAVCTRIAQRNPDDPFWVATIENWTTSDWFQSSPSSPASPGSPPIAVAPPLVRLAVLEQTAEMYRFRGDDEPSQRVDNAGDLSDTIKSLLKSGGYLTETWA